MLFLCVIPGIQAKVGPYLILLSLFRECVMHNISIIGRVDVRQFGALCVCVCFVGPKPTESAEHLIALRYLDSSMVN